MPKSTLDLGNAFEAAPHVTSLTGLPIVRKLLDRLHQTGIEYCHWKSNQHVLEGMFGETDLDMLVAKDRLIEMTEALCQTGYKRFRAVASSGYPAVEDYLAMDQSTGKLVHVHLYYRLIVGEPHLKGYRLPWEPLVLSSRVFLPQHGIFTSCPELEMILLIVRAALKFRMRDRTMLLVGRPYPPSNMVREYLWLKERIDGNRLHEYAVQLVGEKPAASLNDILREGSLTFKGMVNFRKTAMLLLRNYKSYGAFHRIVYRWKREANWALGVINKRYLHLPISFRRTPSGGGVVVALLGCDGSGKSTQIKDIVKWLSWKLDVLPIYFGSGDGSSSILRWPFKFTVHILRGRGLIGRLSTQASKGSRIWVRDEGSWFKRMGRLLWAVFLVLEKKKKMRTLTRARNRGMVVVCDRYPQNQVHGFNDGPLLGYLAKSGSGWMRRIAAWEVSCYALAEVVAPDIVVKLHVTPEVAFGRKPDMSFSEIQRRIDTVRLLQFNSATTVVNIDATMPLEQVTQEIKQRVWESL